MKKNIVLLVNDHQAYYGHDASYIRRPNFDRLAQQGVSFDKVYCSTPLCAPSRRTMITGLHTCHHKQYKNNAQQYLHQTYLEALKDAGYDLFYYGKWHTGRGTPADFGAEGVFCEDYGSPYLLPRYQEYLHEQQLPFPRALIEHNWCTPGWIDDIVEGEEKVLDRKTMNESASGILVTPKQSHEAFFLAHEACSKLRELKDSDRPFCLQVEFWGPHQPYFPTREYADMYPPEQIPEYPSFRDDLKMKPDIYRFEAAKGISQDYRILQDNPAPWSRYAETLSRCYAQITMTDEAGGQVLDTLEELGMMEDTMVIWTTDHGDAIGSHGGHFDKDAYMAEEVLRIPFAMRLDGVIPPGSQGTQLISNVDLAPTLLAAAGTQFREKVDGKNILELFTNRNTPWREYLFAETYGHHIPHRAYAWSDRRYKYVRNICQIEELYDLEKDPYEMTNLVFDPDSLPVLNRMRRSLDDFLLKYDVKEGVDPQCAGRMFYTYAQTNNASMP